MCVCVSMSRSHTSPQRNRIQFTHIGFESTAPAVLDLGALCLVNGVSRASPRLVLYLCVCLCVSVFVCVSLLCVYLCVMCVYVCVSLTLSPVEWFSESQVQTSGTLLVECSETSAGSKWLLGSAKVDILSSKKVRRMLVCARVCVSVCGVVCVCGVCVVCLL